MMISDADAEVIQRALIVSDIGLSVMLSDPNCAKWSLGIKASREEIEKALKLLASNSLESEMKKMEKYIPCERST